MWACQKALHAISEMTASNQSQLIVETRRGQVSVTLLAVVHVASVAETPQMRASTNVRRKLDETVRLVPSAFRSICQD